MVNIFVGNLPYQISEDELQAAFSAFGAVDRVHIVRDRDTGQPRGFAFVEMASGEEANKAMSALNGSEMKGRAIVVNEARPREARAGGGGNRFGAGGGGGRGRGGGGGRRESRW